jgi:hypothetical protein
VAVGCHEHVGSRLTEAETRALGFVRATPGMTREMLQKLQVDKIICRPIVRDGENVYEIRARFHLGRLFQGIIWPRGVSSPTGFEPVSRP